jgi:hypothetical protein
MASNTMPDATDAPALEQADWDAIAAGEITPAETPANGDIRYGGQKSGELPGEDDDNEFQESDEALPSREEERVLHRDPGKEGSRFDEL